MGNHSKNYGHRPYFFFSFFSFFFCLKKMMLHLPNPSHPISHSPISHLHQQTNFAPNSTRAAFHWVASPACSHWATPAFWENINFNRISIKDTLFRIGISVHMCTWYYTLNAQNFTLLLLLNRLNCSSSFPASSKGHLKWQGIFCILLKVIVASYPCILHDLSMWDHPCSHFYFDIKFGDRLYSK